MEGKMAMSNSQATALRVSHVAYQLRDQFGLTRLQAEWWIFRNFSRVLAKANPDDLLLAIHREWQQKGHREFMQTMAEHYNGK
jgi:hypothetical protein